MLWPTGVLQDEIEVAGDREQKFMEIDRRGSSCPTLFVWDGERYKLVGDMLGAGVVGHWVGPGQRDIPRPTEYIKIDRDAIREKDGKLSFRFMEPLEEAVYLDQVKVVAVDHPADLEVYPNEYFASNPPYPPFKVVVSQSARPPVAAHDEHGHDVFPDLLAHRYFGDFGLTQFAGFAKPHSLELDLGEPYAAARSGCCCTARLNISPPTACTPRRRPELSPLRHMSKRSMPGGNGFASSTTWAFPPADRAP